MKKYNINKDKIKEIENRIEKEYKEYISKMKDNMLNAEDFEMTN